MPNIDFSFVKVTKIGRRIIETCIKIPAIPQIFANMAWKGRAK